MLLVLMFHKVTEPNTPEHLAKFEHFLICLKSRYNLVMPGDKAPWYRLNVCLTFDDAHADFYAKVYPVLKKHQIKAVLGVISGFTQKTTTRPMAKRLNVLESESMQSGVLKNNTPFCTWAELKTLHDSGLVQLASHAYGHIGAKDMAFDITKEGELSKQRIIEKTGATVDTFIYPYGHFQKNIHQKLQQHYQYIMRIGAAINWSWGGKKQLLYRVNADPFWMAGKKLNLNFLLRANIKWLSNQLRNK